MARGDLRISLSTGKCNEWLSYASLINHIE
jgi:hypothetical protein